MNAQPAEEKSNIVALPTTRHRSVKVEQRFKVIEFQNASGSTSYRVDGYKRDGKRVRENFAALPAAECRQTELELEYKQGHTETGIQATKLTADQLRLCEAATVKLGDDWAHIVDAVTYWQQHGKKQSRTESPRIDDAVTKFNEWLTDTPKLRDHTKKGLRLRVGIFANGIGNLRVNEITIENVEAFLDAQKVSDVTKDNYKRAISRFFRWCIERPRRWATSNPCAEIRIETGERHAPEILTVEQCRALLKQSATVGLAPYVALCMFGGLRPSEAARLDWKAVNLKDREIRLDGTQTKTGDPRTVAICDTLAAWLKAYDGKTIVPKNWRRNFDKAKESAGLITRKTAKSDYTVTKIKKGKPVQSRVYWKKIVAVAWTPDILRHTAISHYFRETGSYGRTAEQFGNSEAIIKAHYQGRVTSDDTKKFYAIMPKKGAGR